jgi:hypothetical protein
MSSLSGEMRGLRGLSAVVETGARSASSRNTEAPTREVRVARVERAVGVRAPTVIVGGRLIAPASHGLWLDVVCPLPLAQKPVLGVAGYSRPTLAALRLRETGCGGPHSSGGGL